MNITTSKLQILEYLQKITRGLRMNELGVLQQSVSAVL